VKGVGIITVKLGVNPNYRNFKGKGRKEPPVTACRYARKHFVRWVSKQTGIPMKKVDLVIRGIEEFFLLAASEGNGVNWNNFFAMRVYHKGDKWKSNLYDRVIEGVDYVRFTASHFMRKAKWLRNERYTDSSLPDDIRQETAFKRPLPVLDLTMVKDEFSNDNLDIEDIPEDNMLYIVCTDLETGDVVSKEELALNAKVTDTMDAITRLNNENENLYYEIKYGKDIKGY
jgi:hypothetical protein